MLRNWVRAAGASRPRLQRCGWLRRPPSPPNASLTTSPTAVFLPAFLHFEVNRHLDWYAEKEPDGLLFVGERGAPFRRSTFGRKWRSGPRSACRRVSASRTSGTPAIPCPPSQAPRSRTRWSAPASPRRRRR